MENVLFVFLIFALIVGGLILQIEIASYDFSSWNFTGSDMASGFLNYSGIILMVIGAGVLIEKSRGKR